MESDTGRIYYSPNVVNLCIDAYSAEIQSGQLWSQYKEDFIPFSSLYEALERMEDLYDALQYPYSSTETRSFLGDEGRRQETAQGERSVKEYQCVESFDHLISHRGQNATFIIWVQYRQHSSWQGEVIWAEAGKRKYFRSILELMRLIGGTLEKKDAVVANAGNSR